MPERGGATKNFYLPLARRHVTADRWIDTPGTDFWLMPALLSATSTAGLDTITSSDGGWTMEAEHAVIGSAGDFGGGALTAGIPATPGIPTHYALILTGDLIVSPPVFGGYDHMLAAAWCVGKKVVPTSLNLECRAAFTVGSADEPTSGFGFFEDATTTTAATEALQLAFISSNGVNYELNTNASTSLTSVGAAIAVAWKTWKISIRYNTAGVATASWYINGALQGSLPPTTGEAPYAFGAHVLTTNVLKLGPVHIWYDW